MIKGISKQIIEIKCPNNEYFEKALLFVNTKNQMYSAKVLKAQAKIFSRQLDGDKNAKKCRSDLASAKILCAAVISVLAVLAAALALFL